MIIGYTAGIAQQALYHILPMHLAYQNSMPGYAKGMRKVCQCKKCI